MTRSLLSLVCAAALTMACNTNPRNDNRADTRDESGTVGTSGEATTVNDSDRDFINDHLADGTAEVDLAKVAQKNATSPDVKRFAAMMVQDHTKAGNELKQVAMQHNVAPAPQVDEKHRDLMDRLSKLKGADFDREYINAMIDDHEDAIDSLQPRVDSTASLKDRLTNKDSANAAPVPERSDNALKASVNAWAATALPTVRHHLDEAKMIKDKLDARDRNTTARK
jgi:putative membrane protein